MNNYGPRAKEGPLQAAYWFLKIWQRDERSARVILGMLHEKDLSRLVMSLPLLKLHSEEFRRNFFSRLRGIFKDSKALEYKYIEAGERRSHLGYARGKGDSGYFNIFFIVFSTILLLILIWSKSAAGFDMVFFEKNQEVWLTLAFLLILFPFFLSLGLKYKYFRKAGNVFESFFSITLGSLLLIGLLAILNFFLESDKKIIPYGDSTVIMVLLFASLLGPFVEEVLFRGLFFDFVISFTQKNIFSEKAAGSYKSRDNIKVSSLVLSMFVSSFSFALVHRWENLSGLFIYFVCGLILAWQRYSSGYLWNSWVTHAIANGVILFIY